MRDRWATSLIGAVSLLVLVSVGVLTTGVVRTPAGRPDASSLPALNACLNATSACLLVSGWVCVRRRRLAAHRLCMLSALATSSLFLVSYLVYHARVGSVPFTGTGWVRPVYFSLLVSHVILAAVIVPLALTTVHRAWTAQFTRHVAVARWTLPLWLYVSVTGVVVYWMVHQH